MTLGNICQKQDLCFDIVDAELYFFSPDYYLSNRLLSWVQPRPPSVKPHHHHGSSLQSQQEMQPIDVKAESSSSSWDVSWRGGQLGCSAIFQLLKNQNFRTRAPWKMTKFRSETEKKKKKSAKAHNRTATVEVCCHTDWPWKLRQDSGLQRDTCGCGCEGGQHHPGTTMAIPTLRFWSQGTVRGVLDWFHPSPR